MCRYEKKVTSLAKHYFSVQRFFAKPGCTLFSAQVEVRNSYCTSANLHQHFHMRSHTNFCTCAGTVIVWCFWKKNSPPIIFCGIGDLSFWMIPNWVFKHKDILKLTDLYSACIFLSTHSCRSLCAIACENVGANLRMYSNHFAPPLVRVQKKVCLQVRPKIFAH